MGHHREVRGREPLTTFVLARHGETIWHAADRYAGSSDVPLTPVGKEQAQRLARWSATADLTAVWSSGLVRADATARPCAEAAGVDVRVDDRLREMDFGGAEGLSPAEIDRRFPGAYQAFEEDPVANRFPGAEDPDVACRRALGCLGDIAAAYPDGRVLVIGHGTVTRLVLCQLLGLPLREYRRRFPVMRNTGLTELQLLADGGGALLAFNATPVTP